MKLIAVATSALALLTACSPGDEPKDCTFPSVPNSNAAVSYDFFGPVPRANGVLPANMPLGIPFDGPVEGTEYVRISSASGNGGHYYSTVQAWNADMSRIMIGNGAVDQNRMLDTRKRYSLVSERVSLSSDRIWSNTDPDIVYGISGKTTVYKLNVATGERIAIYTHPDDAQISFMGKPAIPQDDSKMVFLVRDQNKLVTIDLLSEEVPRPVIGELDWTPYGDLNQYGLFMKFDHGGEWVAVKPNAKSGGNGEVLNRLPPDLSSVEVIGPMCCHSDTALNTKGQSVEVETRRKGIVRVHNYDTKTSYDSPQIVTPDAEQKDYAFPSYISGRGQSACGRNWAVLSGEAGDGSPNHPLVLYKIDGKTKKPTFKVIGGDLHSGAPVAAEDVNDGKQKAVQSPDGNAIMFDSDGGIAGGELSTYILRVKEIVVTDADANTQ